MSTTANYALEKNFAIEFCAAERSSRTHVRPSAPPACLPTLSTSFRLRFNGHLFIFEREGIGPTFQRHPFSEPIDSAGE